MTNAAAGAIGWARFRPALAEVGRGAVLLTAVVGLLSVLEGLKSWSVLVGRLQQTYAAAPALAEPLQNVGLAIHAIVEAFRAIFRPLFDFSFGWTTFEPSALAQDAIVVCLLVAVAHWPNGVSHFRAWRRMSGARKRAIIAAAREAGLKCGIGDARTLLEALEALAWEQSYPGSMTEYDSKRIEAKYVEKARARFGPAFGVFARTRGSFEGVPPRLHRLPWGVAMQLVWALAAIVGMLAAIDWVFLS